MKTKRIINRSHAFFLALGAVAILPYSSSAATLTHRYTFDKADVSDFITIKDSVGTAHGYWTNNGTFAGGDFDTYPGKLNLTGNDLGAGEYGVLPSGIITNTEYTSLTIDTWAEIRSPWGFLWSFGNTDSGSGFGGNALWLQTVDARATISSATPSWGTEQNANFSTLAGYVHVTVVLDPPNQTLAVYTNGSLASINKSITHSVTNISDVYSYIGKSVWAPDGLINPIMDELRIWNGAMNFLEVAGCNAAGPNAIGTPASIGTVTNISASAPFTTLLQGAKVSIVTYAQASLFTNGVNGGFRIPDPTLCQYYSSDTNYLTVNTNGQVTATLALTGSASVTTVYQGLSNTIAFTIVPPTVSLMHRYDFADDGTGTNIVDSVGGVNWNGWVVNPVGGEFGANAGQLTLQAANSQYAQFPSGILDGYNTVTVDIWATCPTALPTFCWLWAFGQTDGGGGGGNTIFFQAKNGSGVISGGIPTWLAGEQIAAGAGDLSSRTNVHITTVYNPVAGWSAVYLNGKLVGKNTGITFNLSQVHSTNNYIAKSLYTGDPLIDVTVNEYRILNGPMTSQQIALAHAAGTDSIPNTVTNGPGALLGFNVNVPATMQLLQYSPVTLLANYQNLTNFDLIGNSIFPPVGLAITSDNTSVLTYDENTGFAHAVGVGTAKLIVSYQGVSTTNTITVAVPPSTSTLVHRYSFSETSGTAAADSVGGSVWDGTLPNGGTFGGGQLALASSGSQYVNLPAGILSNYTNVTIDGWVTFGAGHNFLKWFWAFGNTDGGGAGGNCIFSSGNRAVISGGMPSWAGPEQSAGSGTDWANKSLHITAVYNPSANYLGLYRDGTLDTVIRISTPLTSVSNVYSYIGRALYSGDPYADLSIDEFRIFNGALTSTEVANYHLAGPNSLTPPPTLAVTLVGANAVVSWPTNFAGYTLQSKVNLTGGAWNPVGTAPVVTGANYQVTLPATNAAQFFRLSN